MKMVSFVNFNSLLNTNRACASKEEQKNLINKTNQDQEHSTELRLASTQDKLDKIKNELKKSLNQGRAETWLAKPKFITKNHISNPKGMTKTSHKLLEQLNYYFLKKNWTLKNY